MAFPTIEGTAGTLNAAANTTAPAVPYPTVSGGILAGDLLILVGAIDQSTSTVSSWNGFTQGAWGAAATSAAGGWGYKWASGGESGTLTLTTTSERQTWSMRCIRGAHSSTPPESASANASSTNPDPPSLTPSWGAEDTLWLAVAAIDDITIPSAAPTNYGNFETITAATSGASQAIATRTLNAATENPGTFTMTTDQWVAYTIAIRPAPAGSNPTPSRLNGVGSFPVPTLVASSTVVLAVLNGVGSLGTPTIVTSSGTTVTPATLNGTGTFPAAFAAENPIEWTGANGDPPPSPWVTSLGAGTGGSNTIQDGRFRQVTPSTSYHGAMAFYGSTSYPDLEFRSTWYRYSPATGADQYVQVAVRSDAWNNFGTPDNGYAVSLATTEGQVRICSYASGVETIAASTAFTFTVGVPLRVVVRCTTSGNDCLIKAKVWQDGQVQPSSWTLEHTFTNAVRTTGKWGLANSVSFGNEESDWASSSWSNLSSTGTTVSPAAINGTGSFPQATISASNVIAVGAINGVGSFPTPTLQASATASPGTLVGASAFPALAISTTGRAAPVALAGVGSFPVATVTASGLVVLGQLNGIGTFPQAVPTAQVFASPAVLNGVGTLPTPTLSATGQAAPAALAGAGTWPQPTVVASGRPLPAVLLGSGSFPAPLLRATGTGAPAALQGVGSFPTASPSATGTAIPNVLNSVGTFPTPSITTTGAGTATPSTLNGLGSFGTPTIQTGGPTTVSVNTLSGTGSFGAVVVSATGRSLPNVINGVGSFGTPTLLVTTVVAAPFIPGIGSFGAPTITTTARALPSTLNGLGTFPSPLAYATGAEKPNYKIGGPLFQNGGEGRQGDPLTMSSDIRISRTLTLF